MNYDKPHEILYTGKAKKFLVEQADKALVTLGLTEGITEERRKACAFYLAGHMAGSVSALIREEEHDAGRSREERFAPSYATSRKSDAPL